MGLSESQLAGVLARDASSEEFSPLERAVVRYARQLTRVEPIDDALYDELRASFSLHQVMELCFTVGIANMVNRFHATFHTPLDARTSEQLERGGTPLDLPDGRSAS